MRWLCGVLKVQETGYYRWVRHNRRPKRTKLLRIAIQAILAEHKDNDNYGIDRILRALEQREFHFGRRAVYRCMRENGWLHKKKRNPHSLTKADRAAQKSENLLQRNFAAPASNRKWLTDITEIPCKEGKLYVAPILDCYNGEIVALSMGTKMDAGLCVRAFEQACTLRHARGMLVHSDRGSQYTSRLFRESLARHGAIQSMSGTGKCYDNARMESFFATLKKEKIYRLRTEFLTIEQVKTIVFRYIFFYYNTRRVCSFNPGGWPPAVFATRHFHAA